jgi:hypothetical protein
MFAYTRIGSGMVRVSMLLRGKRITLPSLIAKNGLIGGRSVGLMDTPRLSYYARGKFPTRP